MKKRTLYAGAVVVGTLPLVALPAGEAGADDDPELALEFDVADYAAWSGSSPYFNIVDDKSCDADYIDPFSEEYFRIAVDADCIDGMFIYGVGYGSLDEDDILANMDLTFDDESADRSLSLSRQLRNGYYARKAGSGYGPGDYARVFDASLYPCEKVLVGVGAAVESFGPSIDRQRTLKCASDAERGGPGRSSVGYASDPVNTATGSFVHEETDLTATAGVFGLDWRRTYDSGGPDGTAAWSYSFSDRVDAGEDGSMELTTDSRKVVYFPNGSGGFLRGDDYDGQLSPDGTDWVVSYSDGSKKRFASTGEMTSWSAWDGQEVVATYTSGQLTALTSSRGPSLTLAYASGRLDTVTASDGRVASYDYDMNGYLAEIELPGSVTWTYGNDATGRIETIEDPAGVITVDNTYGLDGRVASQLGPTGSETTFDYTTPDTVVVTDVVTSTAVTYRYDVNGRLTSIEDPFTAIATRNYDEYDLLTSAGSRAGGSMTVGRNDQGLPEVITEPGTATSTEISFSDDGSNRIEAVVGTEGTSLYTYDGDERTPSTVTNELNHTTTYDVNDTTGLVDSVTDADGVTIEYRYNALGQVEEIEDEYGNVTTYAYDAVGRRSYIQLPSGAETTIEFDGQGRVWRETAADSGLTTTTYDASGRLDTVTDAELGVTDYDYDPVTGLLEQVTDPMLRVTTYDYDDNGELETVHHPDASTSGTEYGPLGRLRSRTDEVGRTTEYGYDADGNVTTVEDHAGGVVESHYDAAGRLEWTDDASDRRTSYEYDPDTGLLESETSPAGTVTYTYDALGRQKTVTDLRGGETETEYTAGGRIDWVDDPLDRRTDYTYDDAGRLWKTTAPGNLTTEYGYDADSHVNVVTTPEGNETATTYDGLGRVLTTTDPAGVVTTNTWTKTGQIKTNTKTGEGTVTFDYYADGNLESVEDALGNLTSFEYDNRGRLEKRIDAELNEWLTDYNPAGELVSQTDPLSRTTTYTYDAAGRIETESDPSGRTSTSSWHLDGRLERRDDVLGTETRSIDYSYDAAGRRISAAASGTSPWPLADTTKLYTYNDAGDLTSESLVSVMGAAVRTQRYDYDIAGRRTKLQRADGTTVDYHYDAAGTVDKLTAGEVAADSYAGVTTGPLDLSKWDITTTAGGSAAISNGAGDLTVTATPTSSVDTESLTPAATDGDTAVTYSFASASTPTEFHLSQRTTSTGDRYSLQLLASSTTAAITKTVSGTTSTLATFTVPVGTDPQRARLSVVGSTISAKVWDPDTAEPNTWSATTTDTSITADGTPGLRAAVGAGSANTVTVDDWTHSDPSTDPVNLVDYGWDDDAKLTSELFADGGTRDWTWSDGRLTGLDQDIPGAVHTSLLGYDSSGRIDTETVDTDTTDYDYDDAGQIVEANPGTGPTSSWTYDSLGRRDSQTVGGDTTSYDYDDAGQLTTATPAGGPATTYTSDNAGRRLTETTGSDVTTSTYNASGQLAQVDLPSGEFIWRTTDADGASVGFYTDNFSSVRYQFYDWDTTSGLTELTAIAGVGYSITGDYSRTINLARAAEAPWATAQTTESTDALASDVHGSTVESSATTLAASSSYSAWGEATATTAQPKLGYRGELTIAGLTHLRARDYESATGTFTTTDPLDGVPGTTTLSHPYQYGNNDPLNRTDPSGMSVKDADLKNDCSPSTQMWSIGRHDQLTVFGRVGVAGFIPDETSHLDPFGIVGMYRGDGRDFAYGAIPMDKSRFVVSLDFQSGIARMQVNPTHSVDGTCWSAFGIRVNDMDHGWPSGDQRINMFSFGIGESGKAFRVQWSVVHGDRRWFSGATRPAFDGSLVFQNEGSSQSVRYDGDCFPSVEAYQYGSRGKVTSLTLFPSRGPVFGINQLPNCSRETTGKLD
jgi:RHS repeat-associated protein